MSARAAYWTFRRELHAMLRAPIVYVVGGVFLAVQGVAFAGLVQLLSDPRRPAPLGALLEHQLGGTLLTWVLGLVVLTLLGMRTIAEDKRSGAWELLLTAQVGEGAAVVGKWAAAVVVYAVVWIPTLLYLGVVAMFRVDDGGWDLATIATGYLGAIAVGAALLAWAVAASAAMSSTLGAGGLGFAWLIGLFLIGELPALWPELALDHPTAAAGLAAVSVRGLVSTFARGELDLAAVLVIAAIAVVGLSLAITLACAGRRRRREVQRRALGTAAVAAIGALAAVLAVRHPIRVDLSAAGRNSLDPATVAVIASLPGPATITIVRPTLSGIDPIYDEVARVVARMQEVGALEVRATDPARAPGGLPAIARAAGLQQGDLAAGGAVVVEIGGRRRVIDLLALATIEGGPGDAPVVQRLAIEQTVGGALAALAAPAPLTVCATTGQGELSLVTRDPGDADWTVVADRLRGEGATIEELALEAEVPARCDVVVVAGPARPLSAAQALALQHHARRGGGLVIAAASRPVPGGGLASTGLDPLLAAEGLGLPPAIVIDPALTVRELPGALLVVDGYAAHPITDGFAGARATLWFQPRAVATVGDARALVLASDGSWGEKDLVASPPTRDDDDLAGPVALAAIGASGKLVALGSAESMSTAVLAGGTSAGDLWIARALRAVAGRLGARVSIRERPPEQIRLVMTTGQRQAVIAISLGGIPLAWLLLGGAIVWWRRRRAA